MKKLLCLIVLFTLIGFVFADMGPKPTVQFTVTYDSKEVTGDFYARMLSCQTEEQIEEDSTYVAKSRDYNLLASKVYTKIFDEEKNCFWYPARFAWGGNCSEGECNFGYHPPNNFKLVVYLPGIDKTFVTSEMVSTKFDSFYEVNLLSSEATTIKEKVVVSDRQTISLFVSLILTIIIELIVGAIVFFNRYSIKLFATILLMNIISLPIFWLFLLPFFTPLLGQLFALLVCEVIVFLFEGIALKLVNKQLSWKRALAGSFVMNLASFLIGGFILLFATMIFGIGLVL